MPPSLPVAIIATFNCYIGPPFLPGLANGVPICPVTIGPTCWHRQNMNVTRRMLPIILGYALSIHKLQGSTSERLILNAGEMSLLPDSCLSAACGPRRSKDSTLYFTSWITRLRPGELQHNYVYLCISFLYNLFSFFLCRSWHSSNFWLHFDHLNPKMTPGLAGLFVFRLCPFPYESADVYQIWCQSVQPFGRFSTLLNCWPLNPPPQFPLVYRGANCF